MAAMFSIIKSSHLSLTPESHHSLSASYNFLQAQPYGAQTGLADPSARFAPFIYPERLNLYGNAQPRQRKGILASLAQPPP